MKPIMTKSIVTSKDLTSMKQYDNIYYYVKLLQLKVNGVHIFFFGFNEYHVKKIS